MTARETIRNAILHSFEGTRERLTEAQVNEALDRLDDACTYILTANTVAQKVELLAKAFVEDPALCTGGCDGLELNEEGHAIYHRARRAALLHAEALVQPLLDP